MALRSTEAIALRINQLMAERSISSVNKLAMLSGVPQVTIQSIIDGRSRDPKLSTITKIATGLGVSLKELFDCPIFLEVDDD